MTRPLFAAAATALLALATAGCLAPSEASPSPVTVALDPATLRTQAHAGLRDRALLDALYEDVRGHTSLGYRRARREVLGHIDLHGGVTECIYTGLTAAQATFNVEHSWPQSLGAGQEPAKSDLHHLFASADFANSRRSNYPFGDTDCEDHGVCKWASGGSNLGDDARGHRVFEVRPERRGDVARAQFYFATRYRRAIDDGTEATLRAWHDADPPDGDEAARNDAVEALQHNRNPFVDEPDLVGRIDDF